MKVLHFFDGRRNNTRIIQIEFISMLKQFCEFYVYGPRENDTQLSPITFDPKLKLSDVVKEFNPDLVLLTEHAITKLMFGRWGDLSTVKNIPKVSIEIDYYDILDNLDWHVKSGIDFIINRGPYTDDDHILPHVWLPWSAHNMFYTDPDSNYLDNRIQKLIFIGGGRYSRNIFYSTRQKAIRILEAERMLDYFDSTIPELYKKYITSYVGNLSCSFSGLRMAPAKTFEILASGSALLTTNFKGEDVLFNKMCYLKYNEDCSDVIDMAKIILSDRDFVKEMTKNALIEINSKHLHSHRIVELYNILKALVDGKEVPRVWGL